MKRFLEDLRVYAYHTITPWEGRSGPNRAFIAIGMVWRTQSLSAVMVYRMTAWARRRRIPLLPSFLDKLNMGLQNVFIGEKVEIGPGLYIAHGNIVVDGVTTIGARCAINPWVTIGLSGKPKSPDRLFYGPTIGDDVYIGTGAKILGEITIGDGAVIGANAVVLSDVPANHVAVGSPARTFPKKGREPLVAVRAAEAEAEQP